MAIGDHYFCSLGFSFSCCSILAMDSERLSAERSEILRYHYFYGLHQFAKRACWLHFSCLSIASQYSYHCCRTKTRLPILYSQLDLAGRPICFSSLEAVRPKLQPNLHLYCLSNFDFSLNWISCKNQRIFRSYCPVKAIADFVDALSDSIDSSAFVIPSDCSLGSYGLVVPLCSFQQPILADHI